MTQDYADTAAIVLIIGGALAYTSWDRRRMNKKIGDKVANDRLENGPPPPPPPASAPVAEGGYEYRPPHRVKTNLTRYDWACITTEFAQNRLHLDETVTTFVQMAIMLGGWFYVAQNISNSVLQGLAFFGVMIGSAVVKHYSMKKEREAFAQRMENRDRLYWEED